MSSTPDNLQPIPVAPLIPEQESGVGTSSGINLPTSNPATAQPSIAEEPVCGQSNQEASQRDQQQEQCKPTPKGNFITKYRDYADVVEVPADAHEAIAMSLIAAVLNRNGVTIQHGAIPITMDFWVILISGSGAGRNTLVGLASPVLKKSGLANFVRTSAWGSEVALYQNLAENPNGLYVWPELSIILKKFGQSNFGGAKVWVTDRYDNFDLPHAVTYRKTGRKDTPSIEFTEAPRLNIIATSSDDWLMTNLVQEDTTGGFLPRFILVKLEGREKTIPIPRKTDPRLVFELSEELKLIDEIRGTVTLSGEVESVYVRWYYAAKQRFLAQANPALAMPFFNRLRVQVLKLAVIHEVAESRSITVSAKSMEKAIATAAKLEETIFALLPTGMNREGAELMKIEQRIKEAGIDGISQSVLTRAFQSTLKSERTQRIQTLCQGGAVIAFRRGTGGRVATIYVHAAFADDHSTKFPEDQRP